MIINIIQWVYRMIYLCIREVIVKYNLATLRSTQMIYFKIFSRLADTANTILTSILIQ